MSEGIQFFGGPRQFFKSVLGSNNRIDISEKIISEQIYRIINYFFSWLQDFNCKAVNHS